MSGLFLKTIRFDASDAFAFPLAAEPDEWAVSGAFAFANANPGELDGKARQAFANGFLGLSSFGFATIAAVAHMNAGQREDVVDRLARHFIDAHAAPGMAEARDAARAEVEFIEDLVKDSLINTLFAVSRTFDDQGRIIEHFRRLERRVTEGPIFLGPDSADDPAGSVAATRSGGHRNAAGNNGEDGGHA